MATVAEAIDATETDWIVSEDIDDALDYFTVDSEVIRVRGHFPASLDPQTRAMGVSRIRVERGYAGSTAATHNSGATLTPVYFPAVGGGPGGSGVTVDNTVDPPAEVTTIIAPGAVIAGDEATLPSSGEEQWIRQLGPFLVNATDEGLTGAGVLIHTFEDETFLYDVVVTTTTAFDGDASLIEVVLPVVGSIISRTAGVADPVGKSALVVTGETPRRLTAGTTVHVTADGEPTVGQAAVYLLYAAPLT